MDADRIARLRLIRSENVGPVSYRQLLARFGTAAAALAALPDLAARAGKRQFQVASQAGAEREAAVVAKAGGRYLFHGLAPYPARLAELEDAPPVLTAIGHAALLDKPAVAMVGARNASAAGAQFARRLAAELGEAGLVVVSGMARGIDQAAHTGALATGTVAAVAGGADVAYPPELAALQRAIGERGLIVAEQPVGVEPQARHFPRRNRVISGLSLGVVVVEAALRSGSLITARLAAEQGREVMAVPGSPLDPRALGGNGLIREGATLVQSAADIIECVDPFRARAPRAAAVAEPAFEPEPDARDAARVEALLGPTPVAVDELARQAGVGAGAAATILLDLELAGRLARHAGGRVALSAG